MAGVICSDGSLRGRDGGPLKLVKSRGVDGRLMLVLAEHCVESRPSSSGGDLPGEVVSVEFPEMGKKERLWMLVLPQAEVDAPTERAVSDFLREYLSSPEAGRLAADGIEYAAGTLIGKHGAILEVVKSIAVDGRHVLVLTDEDALKMKDAPFKKIFYVLALPRTEADPHIQKLARRLMRESMSFRADS